MGALLLHGRFGAAVDVAPDPIDGYVEQLRRSLDRHGQAHQDLLDEVADHLRSIQEELAAAGVGDAESAQRAVERFGPVDAVGDDWPSRWLPFRFELGLLVAVVFVACGLGGALEAGFASIVGDLRASDGAAAARITVSVLIGLVGLGIGEMMWLHRGSRTLRAGRRIEVLGTAALTIVAIGMMAGVAVTGALVDAGSPAPWATRGIAFAIGTLAYIRVRRRLVRPVVIRP
jgi:hypothetical protein